MTSISSHATVSDGKAHHTRLVTARDIGGGGGGRGTLDGAVMPLSLGVASITVTEVTTRIVLVGGLALIGLLIIQRSAATYSRHRDGNFVVMNLADVGATQSPATRVLALLLIALTSGLALGIGSALVLLALLNGLN
ncbi:MAG: hypothetical protein ACO3II_07395 [Ilumatobacteraceae bacterium]|jgi:hypothetical protein